MKTLIPKILFFGFIASMSALQEQTAFAASATWNENPADNRWFNANNWTPVTVPGDGDTATFDASDQTEITGGGSIGEIVFTGGASAYSFSPGFAFTGVGITNNSSVIQNFDYSGGMRFEGQASAGIGVVFASNGTKRTGIYGAFWDHSDAGSGTFINNGALPDSQPAALFFEDQSSAANSMIINTGPQSGGQFGAQTNFFEDSSAGSSTITCQAGAYLFFSQNSTAANATLIADGGFISFENQSNGGAARVELLNEGLLELSDHVPTAVTLGSLEGDGVVSLGKARALSVGSNSLSTTFSGVIQATGSLTKVGSGTWTLSGLNTYTGGTTVEGGTLLVNTGKGSATGSAPVQVNAGTFGGPSNITGAVTIGSGSGTGAFLAPGINGPGVLVIRNTLTFQSDGTYQCDLSTAKSKADQVIAKGITIESGAQFALTALGNQSLPVGTVFTVINNKSRQQISGTFSNLPDHSTLTVGNNSFEASYEGGDGNDLTLTVQ